MPRRIQPPRLHLRPARRNKQGRLRAKAVWIILDGGKTAFKKAVSLSKLEDKISPHTLRHTAATWLMQIGVSTWDAAGFLGMSEKTLRDVYGHHHPDYLQGAAKAIGTKKPVSLVKQYQRRPLPPQRTLKTLVADTVAVEPVSTAKFPANREKNREFFNFGPHRGLEHPMRPMILRLLSQISYSMEQGTFRKEQGFRLRNREFKPPKPKSSLDEVFGTYRRVATADLPFNRSSQIDFANQFVIA